MTDSLDSSSQPKSTSSTSLKPPPSSDPATILSRHERLNELTERINAWHADTTKPRAVDSKYRAGQLDDSVQSTEAALEDTSKKNKNELHETDSTPLQEGDERTPAQRSTLEQEVDEIKEQIHLQTLIWMLLDGMLRLGNETTRGGSEEEDSESEEEESENEEEESENKEEKGGNDVEPQPKERSV